MSGKLRFSGAVRQQVLKCKKTAGSRGDQLIDGNTRYYIFTTFGEELRRERLTVPTESHIKLGC